MKRFKAYRLFQGEARPEGRIVDMGADELSAGDVLVRTHYASVNYKDALAATGINKIITSFPRIGGIDLVGTVEESGDPRYRAGDAVVVHGFGIGIDTDGGFAEYARVAGDWILPLPAALAPVEAATCGVAGYTAALSIHLMELNGLSPDAGKVLVNGATGGVASIAIDMLARRGYRVTAVTGKIAERDYLLALGAAEVIERANLAMGKRALEKPLWAGALDSVGGETLSWLTRSMQPYGVIASFGNAGGMEFAGNVLPFILRGVRLLGINANSPMALRKTVWSRIAGDLKPRHLAAIRKEIALEELPQAFAQMLAGASRGRNVVKLHD